MPQAFSAEANATCCLTSATTAVELSQSLSSVCAASMPQAFSVEATATCCLPSETAALLILLSSYPRIGSVRAVSMSQAFILVG